MFRSVTNSRPSAHAKSTMTSGRRSSSGSRRFMGWHDTRARTPIANRASSMTFPIRLVGRRGFETSDPLMKKQVLCQLLGGARAPSSPPSAQTRFDEYAPFGLRLRSRASVPGRHQIADSEPDDYGEELDVPQRTHREHLYAGIASRSEEHTSELQSHHDLVCRLLLE